ncbi:MAG TPA: hypothetical protein VJZ32_13185, partial [Candidatus Bathyarchaeia archaeon]|nr:hypothetical protein [Candidatus Bathyarchaeia archaeon]
MARQTRVGDARLAAAPSKYESNPDYSVEHTGIASLSGRVSSDTVYACTKMLCQNITAFTAMPIVLIIMRAAFR